MFYPFEMSASEVDTHCYLKYGVTPDRTWITESYGGIEGLSSASNIVFSNGGMDPWAFGGVTPDTPLPPSSSSSLGVVWIPEGAHHLDLFFTNPADPPSVKAARQTEMAYIKKWLAESAQARAGQEDPGNSNSNSGSPVSGGRPRVT